MAASITTNVLNNGPRNYVIAVQIVGDAAGDVTRQALFSDPTGGTKNLVLWKATGSFVGFGATLLWEHSTTASSKQALVLNDAWGCYDFRRVGGLANTTSAAARTGGMRISTSGLGANDTGTMLLEFKKQ